MSKRLKIVLWVAAGLVVLIVISAVLSPGEEAGDEPQPAAEQPEPEPSPEPEPVTETTAAPEPEPVTETTAAPEPEPVTETTAAPEPEPVTETTAAPELEPEPVTEGGVSDVLALLDALTVAAEHTDGYDRELFDHWIDADGDGCDTRREVLLAEAAAAPTVGDGCTLFDGTWVSRYDGETDAGGGGGFDVDHLVPLAEAWESGAHTWSDDRREQFANDLGYEHSLVAVSAGSNRSKGARDPAEWLPEQADQRCWYAASWVAVKHRWSLSVDPGEADELRGVLSGCSDDSLEAGPSVAVVQEPPTTTSAAAVTVVVGGDCHPAYSPCLPNLSGDAINCRDLTADQKPVTVLTVGVDPYQLDRDGDGQGCTS